jgi:tripartite-type tricarboxylate transporter receptor subunit TctC
MPNRREVLRGGAALPAALAAVTLIPEALHAQAFPARTITIVAPFPPGGVADYAARPLAAFLGTKFGKNVVVENRPGAGGGVGHAYVARAEPDGHTIMCSLPSLAVIPEANRLQGRPVNYEMTDFVPIARLFADPVLLVVKKESKWRNIQELVEDIKSNPGKIPYGSSGVFGTVHLAQEMFHYLGLTIETVSRCLTKLKRRGIVSIGKLDEIHVHDVCRLCRLTGTHLTRNGWCSSQTEMATPTTDRGPPPRRRPAMRAWS